MSNFMGVFLGVLLLLLMSACGSQIEQTREPTAREKLFNELFVDIQAEVEPREFAGIWGGSYWEVEDEVLHRMRFRFDLRKRKVAIAKMCVVMSSETSLASVTEVAIDYAIVEGTTLFISPREEKIDEVSFGKHVCKIEIKKALQQFQAVLPNLIHFHGAHRIVLSKISEIKQ